MYSITQTQVSFKSGGKDIRVDCFLPGIDASSRTNGGRASPPNWTGETPVLQRFPAVIALHGSGGGHATMAAPASLLAEQGFAVYVLHYFDRTGTTEIDGRAHVSQSKS